MRDWKAADEKTKYGVALYSYFEDKPHRLKLHVGDTVHVLKDHGDWYYGYVFRNRNQKGIFPKTYIHLKDAFISRSGGYEQVCTKEAPIVQEITSVLREWGAIWKNLYINSNRTELSKFEMVWKMMRELIDWRKLIMSRKLPTDETKDIQQKVTNKIDMGNALLGLDLVVRDDEGNIVDPTATSSISLFRQAQKTCVRLHKRELLSSNRLYLIEHQLATQRIQEEKDRKSDRLGPKKTTNFNLYVNVKNFVCRIGEDSDVLMTLYDAKQGQFISENYLIKWGHSGMPRNIDMFNNIRVVFTDLGHKDTLREKVWLVCQIIRIASGPDPGSGTSLSLLPSGLLRRMDLKDTDTKKQTHGIRRPFGVAAIEVTDIIMGSLETDEEKQLFIPFQQCGEKETLDHVVKKFVSAKDVNHKGQGLWVTMKKLHGDLTQAQKEHPHLVSSATAVARKMGFPDVIMAGDVRNDIYVTLIQGEFKRGNKSSDKNVEVTMTVCNQNGQTIKDVISEGGGGIMVSQYKSVIYWHEDRPKWCETVKVAIPIDEFYGSHLKFTFKHRSSTEAKDKAEKPFAMSYVKLMQENGTTLRDTLHDLLVYKMDVKRSDNENGSYLKLPAVRTDVEKNLPIGSSPNKMNIQIGSLSYSPSDNFQISTLVCSTKLTHNVDLMGLLKWRENPAGLKENLVALMKVDGEEIVKFLPDTLDALFNILMQNSDSDVYDNLVFDALIFLIDLISDRKYHQFQPVLDTYIKENFSATLAYNKLMVVLKFYIDNVHDRTKHESMLKAMKSLEYIFKFIIRSRILFAALYEGRGKQQFEITLRQVFQACNIMIGGPDEMTVSVKATALKYLPSTITDVINVFDPKELSQLLVEFVCNVPKDLTKQKIQCMNDIVHSRLFHFPECRRILLPVIMDHVGGLMRDRTEDLSLSIKILSDIMELLYHRESVTKDISTIGLSILRIVIQTVIPMDRQSQHIGSTVAVMTAILRQMSENHYREYIAHFATSIDLTDFLMEILMVFRDLVSKNVYPSDWNEMILLQNSVFLKALRYFSHTIQDGFRDPFEYQLWNNFFHCTITFLTQEPLQLENFSSTKRSKIVSRYKDMRREAGFEIMKLWYNLGHHKIKFIPDIVGPILEMTLIPETELRKATIPMFFDMMQCEFMSPAGFPNVGETKGTFHVFEHEMITQLDILVEGGRGDYQFKELFYDIMKAKCEGHSTMRRMGLAIVETVKELLQRLLEYRVYINDENKENRMSCTVNLLNFYHQIQRQEMYIRYLHKLCDLHVEYDNFTEAAYTLMLYAKLLQWSDDTLPTMLQSDKYPDCKTHRELKEHLYYDMIDYFDKGKMWEKGIEMCKELAHQYETETFDYVQLSHILTQQSSFYDRIMKQMRPEPEYFRVGYYGTEFPQFLRNKMFVYRGKEYERLSDFTGRLQNQFPNAKLLKTLDAPGEDIMNSANQYLQINAVTPTMELKGRFTQKRVQDQILKYYKVNEVQKFTYSRRIDEAKNDITCMWLERTNVVTAYPLPGILHWFTVTSTNTFKVSPLENAIETLEKTNGSLKSLIDQHKMDPSLRVDPLGMVLNGVCDAAVNGGIANYKVFYSPEFLKEKSDQLPLVKKLRQVTTLQLLLLQTALDIHAKKIPESLQPFHAHIEQCFTQMKAYVDKEFGIKLTEETKKALYPETPTHSVSVKRIQTMPPQRHSELGLPEATSISPKHTPASRMAQSVLVRTSSSPSPNRSPSRESNSKFYTKLTSNISIVSNGSQGASSSNGHDGSQSPKSNSRGESVVIELSEQLKPARPRRPASLENPTRGLTLSTFKPNKAKDRSTLATHGGSMPVLTPARPPRPEGDRRSRPPSGHFKSRSLSLASNSSSSTTGSGASVENNSTAEAAPALPEVPPPLPKTSPPAPEVPPPLPQKHTFPDYTNVTLEGAPPLPQRSTMMSPRVALKDKPTPPLPPPEPDAPSVPPKKPGRPTTQSPESQA